jgi:transposase
MWDRADRAVYAPKNNWFPRLLQDRTRQLLIDLIPRSNRGRPAKNKLEDIIEAIAYLLHTGAQWRYLPPHFPPFTSVQYYFYKWSASGLLERINKALLMQVRRLRGKDTEPSLVIVDSQSVRTTGNSGPKGYDAGKSVMGRKHHLCVDSNGELVAALVSPANEQDRDGAIPLLQDAFQFFPWIRNILVDEGYKGPVFAQAAFALHTVCPFKIIVSPKISSAVDGFKVSPKRWLVERAIAWKCLERRLTRSYEKSLEAETAWIYLAGIVQKLKRLARFTPTQSF